MVWAVVAVIAVLGVGLPAAGWWATTRRPAPVTVTDRGHGEIDHWLAGQFGLGACDRERVRAAVLAGQPVSHPGLEAAVHELAARVLARRFRPLRRAEKLGWFTLVFGPACAAFGMAMLIIGGQGRWQAEAGRHRLRLVARPTAPQRGLSPLSAPSPTTSAKPLKL